MLIFRYMYEHTEQTKQENPKPNFSRRVKRIGSVALVSGSIMLGVPALTSTAEAAHAPRNPTSGLTGTATHPKPHHNRHPSNGITGHAEPGGLTGTSEGSPANGITGTSEPNPPAGGFTGSANPSPAPRSPTNGITGTSG